MTKEGNKFFAACRPKDIEVSGTDGLKAQVEKRIFLGDILEYRVLLGNTELRIQENSFYSFQTGLYSKGDNCSINLKNLRFYETIEGEV